MSTSPAPEASALPAEKGKRLQSELDEQPEPAAANRSPSPSSSYSEGEYSGSDTSEQRDNETTDETQPPLPNEPLPIDPTAPPLPAEPVPEPEDDGWDFHWNANDQSYWFYNRFTGAWQKDNPRLPTTSTSTTTTTTTSTPSTAPAPPADSTTALSNPSSIAGGYNPAIHGSYDENAWYAQSLRPTPTTTTTSSVLGEHAGEGDDYTSAGHFNRQTGQWQTAEQGAERHSDEAKSRRQMRAFFDVDAAANMHDGKSLKAERSGIKPSKAELKVFKERRRAKKEEKRRAWLRD